MYDEAVGGRGSLFRGLDVSVAHPAAAVVDEEGPVSLLYGVRGRGGCGGGEGSVWAWVSGNVMRSKRMRGKENNEKNVES